VERFLLFAPQAATVSFAVVFLHEERGLATGLAGAMLAVALAARAPPITVAAIGIAGSLSLSTGGLLFTATAERAGRRGSGAPLGLQQTFIGISATPTPLAFAAVASVGSGSLAFAAAVLGPAGAAIVSARLAPRRAGTLPPPRRRASEEAARDRLRRAATASRSRPVGRSCGVGRGTFAGALPGALLVGEAHGARVPGAGPRRQQEQQPGVRTRPHLVPLSRLDLAEQTAAAPHAGAVAGIDLDLAVEHHQPRPLVDLMLLQRLPGREIEDDGARVIARGDDPRRVRLDRQLREVPASHRSCRRWLRPPGRGSSRR
jgi:hypothetical protein